MTEEYDICVERAVTLTYVKFTVLNEEWVKNPHGWELDYDGCLWDIALDLKEEIAHLKRNYKDGFKMRTLSFAELAQTLSSRNVNESITALAILVGLFATWSVILFLYTVSVNSIKVES